MRYTKAEKVNIIFIYGECHQIMKEAVCLCAEKFPDRVHTSFSVFSNIVQTFQEAGNGWNVDNKKRKRIKKATDDRNSNISVLKIYISVQDSLNVKVVL